MILFLRVCIFCIINNNNSIIANNDSITIIIIIKYDDHDFVFVAVLINVNWK